MRRYLERIGCVLPGSVGDADVALHSFAAFLVDRRTPGHLAARRSPDGTSRRSSRGWPPAPDRTRPG